MSTKSSTKTTEIAGALEQALPDIDRHLATQDVPLRERPLHAAVTFVEQFVIAVEHKGSPAAPPGEARDFLAAPWFARVYSDVDGWYRARYPDALRRESDSRIRGVIMIVGTPFALRIPVVRSRPGREGETCWISFPDGLRERERPIDWVDQPPNFSMLAPGDLQEAEKLATEVANALRFIRTGLTAAGGSDWQFDGFKAGIVPRLERAAALLLEPRSEPVQQAYWELQIACENALKALSHQRQRSFKASHDLFHLYDAVPAPEPAFKRDLLKRLPRWEEMADLRYGQGERENRHECFQTYRAALSIVAGAVTSMKKLGIGDAEFEIARAPWMEDV